MAFKAEIEKEIAHLQEERKADGMRLELNMVSFNERKAKYDIRAWDENHERMGKGIQMSKKEIGKLKEALNKIEDI